MTSTYIIYEIVCNDENIFLNYVGSTKAYRQRKSQHKNDCNNVNSKIYNLKIYQNIRENGGWENFTMKPLEEFKCDTKIQAFIREQYWMDLKKPKLNIKKAHTSEEQKKQYRKDYNEEHNYNSQYYEKNKEKIQEHTADYYNNNKDVIREKQKDYRKDPAKKIKRREATIKYEPIASP